MFSLVGSLRDEPVDGTAIEQCTDGAWAAWQC